MALPVAQQHLHFLVVCWLVAGRVLAGFLGLPAPLIAPGCELVGCQRARPWSEGAGDCHAAFSIPALVALQHLGVLDNVLQEGSANISTISSQQMMFTSIERYHLPSIVALFGQWTCKVSLCEVMQTLTGFKAALTRLHSTPLHFMGSDKARFADV